MLSSTSPIRRLRQGGFRGWRFTGVISRIRLLARSGTIRRLACYPAGRMWNAISQGVLLWLVFLKLQTFVRCVVADLDMGQRDGSLETLVTGFSYGHNEFVALEYLTKRGAECASD
jgi:hypothetical protein